MDLARTIHVTEVVKSFNIESGGGGAVRFALELAKALDRNRFKISICGLWNYSTPQELECIHEFMAMDIPADSMTHWDERHPYHSMLNAVRGLRVAQLTNPADIVNAHSEFADVAILSLWNSHHRPKLIRTMHHSLQIEWIDRPFRRIMFSNLLLPLLCDLEIGVSQELVIQLDQRPIARLAGRKAYWVNNAIDLERFKSTSMNVIKKRNNLGISSDTFVVGTIGRLVELKGYSHLLDAASLVLSKKSNVVFLIVGDGELSKELKERAAHKGISSHVIFTGGRSDVEELLACMDLFISSSYSEALPTVILESMAAGIPIVATDIPGTRNLIQDKQNGWLVPPRDAASLAQTILNAIEDSKYRRVFSEKAYQDVQSFSIKAVAAEYEKIYSRVA
jgi:glycosyltransferase involved in cell wall biosynthesis